MFDRRIVTIHSVDEWTFSVRRLVSYIRLMKLLGYKFVTVDDVINRTCPRRSIALTVDDAYRNCMIHLLPVLEKYRVPALMFVPVGLLGLPANHPDLLNNECYRDEATMTIEDINIWLQKGFTVGFHTMSHMDLYHQDNWSLIQEDFETGMDLMRKNGWNTSYFAYPKGFLPKERDRFELMLKQQGIKYAFTINWGPVNVDNPYYVNRVCLGNHEYMLWSVLKSVGLVDLYFRKKRIYQEQMV